MIHINNHDIVDVYSGSTNIIAAYYGLHLVWKKKQQSPDSTDVLSCYFNGYWIDEYPWTDDTPWTD